VRVYTLASLHCGQLFVVYQTSIARSSSACLAGQLTSGVESHSASERQLEVSAVAVTAGLLLWTRRGMPMYVLVVPLVWLMAQAPAEALSLGVVTDVARVPIGVVTTAMLVWRGRGRGAGASGGWGPPAACHRSRGQRHPGASQWRLAVGHSRSVACPAARCPRNGNGRTRPRAGEVIAL
jgi:hypothetical protein